jgi:hypothetical protein
MWVQARRRCELRVRGDLPAEDRAGHSGTHRMGSGCQRRLRISCGKADPLSYRGEHRQQFNVRRTDQWLNDPIVLGSDNYNALMGTNFRGLVFSEWALSDPESRVDLRPILVENGGWACHALGVVNRHAF